MTQTGNKYVLHLDNGTDYNICIIKTNNSAPLSKKYVTEVFSNNSKYYNDIMYLGAEFLDKCEKI